MDRLLVFGTGNATVTECYNTCFSLTDGKEFLLVDAGGGNGILGILKYMKVPVERMHHAFLSHRPAAQRSFSACVISGTF